MNDYHCRKCHRWLFASDATYGRVRVTCPSRLCRTDQWVFLGGRPVTPNKPRAKPIKDVYGTPASEPEAGCAILTVRG